MKKVIASTVLQVMVLIMQASDEMHYLKKHYQYYRKDRENRFLE